MSYLKLKESVEAAILGIGFIAVGILIASSVNAQGGKSKSTKQAVESTRCEAEKKPDAICTIERKSPMPAQFCLGDAHSRCFEIKEKQISQIFRGVKVQQVSLDGPSEKNLRAAIDDYFGWISKSATPRGMSCGSVVSIELDSVKKEFCLSSLPKKQADERTHSLVSALEHPTAIQSK